MDNPFLKRLMKKEMKEEIFHSSAYGRAQNDDKVGAASVESFRRRQEIEKNRKMVESYGSSQLANSGVTNGPRAKAYTPPEKTAPEMPSKMAPGKKA